MFDLVETVFKSTSALVAILSVIVAIVYSGLAWRRSNAEENESGEIASEDVEILKTPRTEPFEINALSSYYNQALSRANISFWFSLVFASVGFAVIIFAFLSHDSGDIGSTVIKVISGTVIDAVSALFFYQSTNAQKSMSEFFEKLRQDRLNAEAREMVSEIEDSRIRDSLRCRMILQYAQIGEKNDQTVEDLMRLSAATDDVGPDTARQVE